MESFIGIAALLLIALIAISFGLKMIRSLFRLIFSPAGLILATFAGLFVLFAPTA